MVHIRSSVWMKREMNETRNEYDIDKWVCAPSGRMAAFGGHINVCSPVMSTLYTIWLHCVSIVYPLKIIAWGTVFRQFKYL